MKQKFSVEFKIIIAAAVVLLAFVTVGVVHQIFGKNESDVKFVYNSTAPLSAYSVNISEIIG